MDDIIAMAKESGGGTTWWPLHTDTLERFAALACAAERDRVLKILDDQGTWAHVGDLIELVKGNT